MPRNEWPSFRGPRASGVAEGADPPLSWDLADGDNVRWRVEIPGVGHSSPVVWGGRVFVTTAVSSDSAAEFVHGRTQTIASAADMSAQSWRVYCLSLADGAVLWQRALHEGVPRAPRHVKGSYANPTPATDGRVLVVSFGSEGLYALDLDGNLLWSRDLGVLDGGYTPYPDSHWGFASSPVLHDGLVIVQADTQNQSFLAAFRAGDGDPVWRVPREQDTSWSTPTVVGEGPDAQVVVSGTDYAGYAARDGTELWRLPDGAGVKIPAPLVAGDLILLGGGDSHLRSRFFALRSAARGTLSPDEASPAELAWHNNASPHVVTPIVYDGLLYVCADNGILTIYDLDSGKRVNRLRIGGRSATFSASPVAAGGRLYFASEDGEVFVLAAGSRAELLADNDVGEVVFATPAIVDDTFIVRGHRHVFAFADRDP
ncbi:MAG: PQQ-binding-like beta-propeller repeat protein [Acidobacteriota bacterium]